MLKLGIHGRRTTRSPWAAAGSSVSVYWPSDQLILFCSARTRRGACGPEVELPFTYTPSITSVIRNVNEVNPSETHFATDSDRLGSARTTIAPTRGTNHTEVS